MDIISLFRAEAEKQREIYQNPKTPLDFLCSEDRAEACENIVERIAGMSHEEAVVELQRARQHFQKLDDEEMFSEDFEGRTNLEWFEDIFDQAIRENSGVIKVQSLGIWEGPNGQTNILARPAYLRFNKEGTQVSSIYREAEDSDEVWLDRRKEWLSSYHPDVLVQHGYKRWSPTGDVVVEMGNVATFMDLEHHIEADLKTIGGFIMDKDHFEVVEEFLNVQDGAFGTVRQTEGEPWTPGVHWFHGIPMRLVA